MQVVKDDTVEKLELNDYLVRSIELKAADVISMVNDFRIMNGLIINLAAASALPIPR